MDEEILVEMKRIFSGFGSVAAFLAVSFALLILKQYSLFVKFIAFLVLSTLLVSVIRLLAYRERPKKRAYSSIIEKIDAGSFPSAHAMRIWFIAVSLLSLNLAFGLIAALIGLLVCYSRVCLSHHRLIDVVVGGVLGILFGLMM